MIPPLLFHHSPDNVEEKTNLCSRNRSKAFRHACREQNKLKRIRVLKKRQVGKGGRTGQSYLLMLRAGARGRQTGPAERAAQDLYALIP